MYFLYMDRERIAEEDDELPDELLDEGEEELLGEGEDEESEDLAEPEKVVVPEEPTVNFGLGQRQSITISPRELRSTYRATLAANMRMNGEMEALKALRPKTRADCVDGMRPCPFVSCRHHLALDVNEETGSLLLNFPGEDGEEVDFASMPETCSLDTADLGGATLEEVGNLLRLTRERIRQIEAKCRSPMRRAIETAERRSGFIVLESEKRRKDEEDRILKGLAPQVTTESKALLVFRDQRAAKVTTEAKALPIFRDQRAAEEEEEGDFFGSILR